MKNIMETIQNVVIAVFVALNILLVCTIGKAQGQDLPGKRHSHREPTGARVTSEPVQGPSISCKEVGGGVQECLIRDGQGHTITCHNVGGVCIQ